MKNWSTTSRWLTTILAAIVIASASLVAYNAYADGSEGKMTNGATQKEGYPYPHSYNMTYGFEKDDNGQGDDRNHTSSTNNTSSTSSCGGGESLVNYTGTGSTSSTLVNHNLGSIPRVIYILDMTNSPAFNVDGITTVISTPQVVYVESGNDAYAPVSLANHNIVNSTTVDVGQIFNAITQQSPFSKAVNANGTNYQMVAVNFAGATCSSSTTSSTSGDDDGDHEHS